jgi:hypothetical protein
MFDSMLLWLGIPQLASFPGQPSFGTTTAVNGALWINISATSDAQRFDGNKRRHLAVAAGQRQLRDI